MNENQRAREIYEAKKRGETPEEYQNKLAAEAKKSAENTLSGFKWLGDKISRTWKGLTGETSAEATLKANEMNIANQNYWNQIAMEREDTAYQRQMSDLQAAGLNPWLTTGSGAQSSTLSTAEAEPVDGSKMLQATSAAALLAIVKLLSRKTTRESTNVNFNVKR